MQVPSFGVYDRSAKAWVSTDFGPLAYSLPRARQAARIINQTTQQTRRFSCRRLHPFRPAWDGEPPPPFELEAALERLRKEEQEDGLT